MDMIKSSYQ